MYSHLRPLIRNGMKIGIVVPSSNSYCVLRVFSRIMSSAKHKFLSSPRYWSNNMKTSSDSFQCKGSVKVLIKNVSNVRQTTPVYFLDISIEISERRASVK